jgi:DNA polymerase III subunit delta
MIDFLKFEEQFINGKTENCYVFCGLEEQLIKEYIDKIVKKNISQDFISLNYSKFDGNNVDSETIINACETLPFMSEKKVVVVYRAGFLNEENKDSKKVFENINKYLNNISPNCILIMYYIFGNERDKVSKNVQKLDKKCNVVKVDRLKGAILAKKVKAIFDSKNANIGKVEIKLFCDLVDNDLNIISNEIDKLCAYTLEREITKEDICTMLPYKTDNDIFDLVDFLAQKKPDKAVEILNELIFKGEKIPLILFMIERQFKILFNLKLGMEMHKSKEQLSTEFRLNPYICEKMMVQCKKFTLEQIESCMELCVNTEKNLKTLSRNEKTEIEILIINTIRT